MKPIKYQESEELRNYFNVRLAIVEVRPGETGEDAWNRHIKEYPEQSNAKVRIFNRITKSEKKCLLLL
jgi:hypothetical protein